MINSNFNYQIGGEISYMVWVIFFSCQLTIYWILFIQLPRDWPIKEGKFA